MPTNTESLNRELFRLLSKYKPKPLDAEGKATPVPEEADVFKFEFTKDGEEYGTVYVTLDDERVLTVYFGDDVSDSPGDKTPGLDYDDTWSGLLHQLSSWRMTKGLRGFKTQNKDRVSDDMARRNHMRNKDKIAEGYYATGKKSSYSDAVPSVKIVIEHSRVIEEGEQRYRNINRIFLENQAGERYLLDTKKPGIARVYARHIAEGGKVNDDRWSHIGNLCEEYSKMAGFVRATRNGQFNESAQSLVNEGIEHYVSLRESLSRMTGKRGYNAYFESWTPPLMEDGTEENNLNELFVQETLDPRIESVMPILNRIHKKVSESIVDKEMKKLAEWADSLVEEESIKSNNPVGIPEDRSLKTEAKYDPTVDGSHSYGTDLLFNIRMLYIYARDGRDTRHQIASLKNLKDGIEQSEEPRLIQCYDFLMKNLAGGTVTDPKMIMQIADKAHQLFHPSLEPIAQATREGVEMEEGAVTRTPTGLVHKATDKYGAGEEHTQGDRKTAMDLDHINKKQIKDLDASMGIKWKNQGAKGVQVDDVDESALQAWLGDKKYGEKGMDALRDAGRKHVGKAKMQKIRAQFSKKEKAVSEEVDTGQYDAAKSTHKGGTTPAQEKEFREKVQAYGKELDQRQKEKEKGMAEGIVDTVKQGVNKLTSFKVKVSPDDQVWIPGTTVGYYTPGGSNSRESEKVNLEKLSAELKKQGINTSEIRYTDNGIDNFTGDKYPAAWFIKVVKGQAQTVLDMLKNNKIPGYTAALPELSYPSGKPPSYSHSQDGLGGNPKESLEQGVAEGSGDPEITPGMKTPYGTVVKVNGNTVTVKASNGELTTMNIHDIQQGVAEDLDANQKRVGQLGPTGGPAKVGNLVGANENFINTVDQAVTTEDEMDEGEHTQHAMRGHNPGANEFEHDFEPEDTIGNIHDKISKMLKRLEKPKDKEPNMKDTDLGSTVLESEERPYVCVHAKKGKCEVKASSSYQAAQKAAQKWGLKGTAGIDAHLADVKKDTSSLEESTDELARILTIMNHRR